MDDIQSCCFLIQSSYTSINQRLFQMNKTPFAQKTESHYAVLQMTDFPMLSMHISLSPEQHQTGCCALCCMTLLLLEAFERPVLSYYYCYYEGESNENIKSAIKIRNTARLSCTLTAVILMV